MATPTSDLNYAPSERFDSGPAAAGCNRTVLPATLQAGIPQGLTEDGALHNGVTRVGLSAAGAPRDIEGPNRAGAPRSINGT
jgi:hypothetical protein